MFLEVLYTSLTSIFVMIILQIILFGMIRIMYPPEKIVYRDVERIVYSSPSTLTQQTQQELKIPEYEPREQTSTSLRMDPELPAGLKETRPDGL
jgi:hypothetical protein